MDIELFKGLIINIIGFFITMFLVARILSFLGRGKWSPFGKTSVRIDLYVSITLAIILTALLHMGALL